MPGALLLTTDKGISQDPMQPVPGALLTWVVAVQGVIPGALLTWVLTVQAPMQVNAWCPIDMGTNCSGPHAG